MSFFDKATRTVETVGKNVSKAAKDNMEIVKCSSAIDSCEENLKSIYAELGRRYYNAGEEVTREAFAELFDAIEKNEKEKKELKERLQILKGVEVCKKCGAEIKKGAKFCQWCGAPAEQEEENSGITCPNCHAPLLGTEKFCAVCGCKIEQIQPVVQKIEENVLRCSGCGEIMKETDAFCKHCGTPAQKQEKLEYRNEEAETIGDEE